jgi:hypothetical protein
MQESILAAMFSVATFAIAWQQHKHEPRQDGVIAAFTALGILGTIVAAIRIVQFILR